MKINKYVLFAFIYFFINAAGLPFGLTFTTLLSPFFYWWVVTTRKKEILHPFLIVLFPFVVIHLFWGVDVKSYFVSLLNYTAVYIFCQTFYTFLKVFPDPGAVFKKILIANFILCLIAIPFYFTPFDSIFWIRQYLTEGFDNFRRLKMFTYEASYYATLFFPIFAFFLLKLVLKQPTIHVWTLLLMLFLPYILSFSAGVIASAILAGLLTHLLHIKSLTRKRRVINIALLTLLASVTVLVVLMVFFPDNPFFVRIENVLAGKDSSGKGRTTDAFILANKLLAQNNSHLWGIGIGQIKIAGVTIIKEYYNYPPDYNVIAIPNAAAETLAIFGWAGFCIRILLEFLLFYYTRVIYNYYRLLLFLFIFFYQFTGSFITNLAEYVIWIIAFTNAFPEFNARPFTPLKKLQPVNPLQSS